MEMQGGHWHTNPDNSKGGWISADSQVEPSVYIAPEAQVENGSRISGNVKLLDHAHVVGAIVKDNVVIRDNAGALRSVLKDNVELSGQTTLSGNSFHLEKDASVTVSGNAHIRNLEVRATELGSTIAITGGHFEPPFVRRTYYWGGPELEVAGSYDGETGKMEVRGLGVRSRAGAPLTPLTNQDELKDYVHYSLKKGLETEFMARFFQETISARRSHRARDTGGKRTL